MAVKKIYTDCAAPEDFFELKVQNEVIGIIPSKGTTMMFDLETAKELARDILYECEKIENNE